MCVSQRSLDVIFIFRSILEQILKIYSYWIPSNLLLEPQKMFDPHSTGHYEYTFYEAKVLKVFGSFEIGA